jgi:hypothetical protein
MQSLHASIIKRGWSISNRLGMYKIVYGKPSFRRFFVWRWTSKLLNLNINTRVQCLQSAGRICFLIYLTTRVRVYKDTMTSVFSCPDRFSSLAQGKYARCSEEIWSERRSIHTLRILWLLLAVERTTFNLLKTASLRNNIQECSSYHTGNTLYLRCKYRPVNAV